MRKFELRRPGGPRLSAFAWSPTLGHPSWGALGSPTPDEIDGMRKDGYGGWFWLDSWRPPRPAIKVPKHTPQGTKHV
jgi:hypothetical protein